MFYVLILLVSIVIANLTVAWFGPVATPINAFVLIGLDLSIRDKLHEAWHGKLLSLKMGGVIAVGGLITWLLNRGAGMIAVASIVAFSAALLADTLVYEALFHKPRLLKMNGSNVVSAAVDSVLFPTIAFGVFMPGIIALQFGAKLIGGFLWSLVLTHTNKRTK